MADKRFIDAGDLVDACVQRELETLHRRLGSNHGVAGMKNYPGFPCSGRGAVWEGWKHWAYGYILTRLPAPRQEQKILVVNDGRGPLAPYLATQCALVWAVDEDLIPEEGFLRTGGGFHRALGSSGSPLPFLPGAFTVGIALGPGINEDWLHTIREVLAPTGPLLVVRPSGESHRSLLPGQEDALRQTIPDTLPDLCGEVL